MELDGADVGAFAESVVFLGYFSDLPDPRQCAKVRYPLDEVLLLFLLAVIAGADCIVEIARFGQKKRDLLRRFRPFVDGTPSHDQLGDIVASLDPQAFQRCFVAWVASLTGAEPDVIAIDGKALRRSSHRRGGSGPIHMVSAFAARQRLVLGQVKVADKSNEITAIPRLLAMLDIEGAVVTIDAMGCQRDIARAIVERKADYILALKANQESLHDDVALFVKEQKSRDFRDAVTSRDTTIDADHGRIETRTTTVIHQVGWLDGHTWPGLKSIIVVDAQREIGPTIQTETRLYVTSLALPAQAAGPLVRSHWAIENSLHWVMDMVFRDDECRVRTSHAPANLATIKHKALNLTRRAPGKDSLRVKRKVAAWDDDFLANVITA